MKSIYTFILALCCSVAALAQTDDQQVLVFRNTGVTDLFYTTELDSIVLSKLDTAGVSHDDYVSQVFYTADTALVVPIAEIDSVAFGNHNLIEFYDEVKELTADIDEPWIVRVDSNSIIYSYNTPDALLPKLGQKIFAEADTLFNYGICAKVSAINKLSDGIEYVLDNVQLTDIFKHYFFAGNIGGDKPSEVKVVHGRHVSASVSNEFNKELSLPFGKIGKFYSTVSATITGNAVIDIWKKFANVKLTLDLSTTMGSTVKFEGNYEKTLECSPRIYFPVATVAKILSLNMGLCGFINLDASIEFNYEMKRSIRYGVEWTHRKGENSLNIIKPSTDPDNDVNTAKAQAVLNGSVFFGPQLNLDLSILDLASVREKTKVGPKLSGELSAGVISDLSKEYDYNLYKKGEINFYTRIESSPYLVYRKNVIFGDEEEKGIGTFKFEKEFGSKKINLFPDMSEGRAVRNITNGSNSVKSKTDPAYKPSGSGSSEEEDPFKKIQDQTELLWKLVKKWDQEFAFYQKYGYFRTQKVDKTTGKIKIQEIDTTKIIPLEQKTVTVDDTTEAIVMEDVKDVPETFSKDTVIYFCYLYNYMNHYLPGPPIQAAQGNIMLPITSLMTNGPVTVVSGAPIIGQAHNDTVQAHIGNYLPIYIRDKVAVPDVPTFKSRKFITIDPLIGTWVSDDADTQITLIFNADRSGSLAVGENTYPYTFKENYPQTGQVTLNYDDETSEVISIDSLSITELVTTFSKTNKQYTLNKQY